MIYFVYFVYICPILTHAAQLSANTASKQKPNDIFGNVSSCQVPIETDPTVSSVKMSEPPVIYILWEEPGLSWNYTLAVIALPRLPRKDKIPSCSHGATNASSEPLMDGWHYFYHCNIISPRGLCLWWVSSVNITKNTTM